MREVAVVGVPSPEWGETVEAFVVGDPDLAVVGDLATRELAAFKRPRRVHLVDELPNALGKVVGATCDPVDEPTAPHATAPTAAAGRRPGVA